MPIVFDPTSYFHVLLRRAYPRNRFTIDFYPCYFVGLPEDGDGA